MGRSSARTCCPAVLASPLVGNERRNRSRSRNESMAPATEHNLTTAPGLAEARPAPADSREETAEFSSKPAVLAVTCCLERAYERQRRELFRPTPEQTKGARAWLVRVLARRAVEILKARESPP